MEPSENIPVTSQPLLRSAPPPEPRHDPADNIMPDGPSPNEFYVAQPGFCHDDNP
jgi:hypothetical protein